LGENQVGFRRGFWYNQIMVLKQDPNDRFEIERRSGRDRRTGRLDDKFRHSVSVGFFLDMRKGERRSRRGPEPEFNRN